MNIKVKSRQASSRSITLLDQLMKLQQNYSRTYRAMITQERWEQLVESGVVKEYTLESEFLR